MSNWTTTADGTVIEDDTKVYHVEDGVYDVECKASVLGIILKREEKNSTYLIEGFTADCVGKVKNVASRGDILFSINSHVVVKDELDDTATLLEIIKADSLPQRLRFLQPKKMPVRIYLDKLDMLRKSQTDFYGFARTKEYLLAEKQYSAMHQKLIQTRDTDWVQVNLILVTRL